ncbi:hypothetical protein BX265_8168 [Streptomyces sp. TLI_235]|nr:hypothetical protein [Streptomyces sp. TLI_235]PBC67556.1 hypothetical protein BX265_8168 [Streptomyces sp. TLI_235]
MGSVDDRHLYLARLVRDLGLSITPLVALLDGDEDDCEHATHVLELLAKSGSVQARETLRAYVREGEHWVDLLQSVADCWPVAWWDDLADIARERLAGDQPFLWRSEPWVRWRSRFGLGPPPRPARVRDIEVGASAGQLLAQLADPDAGENTKAHALRLLAHRSPQPVLLALVPLLGSADGERPLPYLAPAARQLGVLAIPTAREWTAEARPWLAWIGAEVLAAHGEARDVPALIGRSAAEWEDGSWCGPRVLASGVARFGRRAAEAAPLLRRFWSHTPHSYERPAYLEALAAVDPAGWSRRTRSRCGTASRRLVSWASPRLRSSRTCGPGSPRCGTARWRNPRSEQRPPRDWGSRVLPGWPGGRRFRGR